MKLQYYGHSCFLIETNGKKILTDPFITHNPLVKGFDIQSIDCDYILISHGHADHIADCIDIAGRTGAIVISSWEIHEWLNKNGIQNTLPMNIGGVSVMDIGMLKCVVAIHSSGLPDGSYGGNPMGFLIINEEGSIYFAGDTALTKDMELIPLWTTLDAALLPIGDHFTMGVQDAAVCAQMIECKRIIGMHFDTFGYIEINHESAKKYFDKAGYSLQLPEFGEEIMI
jgi:L-ascorbate metabolism protein UlaG (beta-lactamase superfamily)